MNFELQSFQKKLCFIISIIAVTFALSIVNSPAYAGGGADARALDREAMKARKMELQKADTKKLKFRLKKTCQCTSSCTGFKQSTSVARFAIPHTPNASDKCQNYCQNWLNSNIAKWTEDREICKTVKCNATSKLGNMKPRRLATATFDPSGKPWCDVVVDPVLNPNDEPLGNTCCPPLDNKTMVRLFDLSSHAVSDGYQVHLNR